jgi:hypothetical protein
MQECYLYFMRSGSGNNDPVKIGVATNPEKRIYELQTGNPQPIRLLAKIKLPSRACAYDLESWLHRRFSHAKMNGEWFVSRGINIKAALARYEAESHIKLTRIKVPYEISREEVRLLLERNHWLTNRVAELEREVRELNEQIDSELDRQAMPPDYLKCDY